MVSLETKWLTCNIKIMMNPVLTQKFIEDKNSFPDLCKVLMNGGSLVDICQDKGLIYSDIVNWIYLSDKRKEDYEHALIMRGEWVASRLLSELEKACIKVDKRNIFNHDGKIKDPSDWPEEVADIVVGFDVDDNGTKKIKFMDKIKSIELLGNNMKMFTDRHEVSGVITLEKLIIDSFKEEDDSDK